MLFSTNEKLPILSCLQCKGSGYIGLGKCRNCHALGMGYLRGKNFLYFGKPLTEFFSLRRKTRRYLNHFEIIGAIVFGFGLIAMFYLAVLRLGLEDRIFYPDFWLEQGVRIRLLFWFGIIFWSFLIYKIIKISDPHKLTSELSSISDKVLAEQPSTWKEVKKISWFKKKDIADSFSEETLIVLENSLRLSEQYNAKEISPLFVFHSLLNIPTIYNVFVRLGISPKSVQTKIADLFTSESSKKMPIASADFQQIIFHAFQSALQARLDFVGPTELLVATVGQSVQIQDSLYDLAVDQNKLANVVEWIRIRTRLQEEYHRTRRAASKRNKHGIDKAMTAVATPYLNSFSKDLTLAAKYGYFPPCVARDKEIDEIFRIINGGRQSVLLVGEHGVGKMSIIEGITAKMLRDDVPHKLKDKRLVQISTSALLSGTTISGAQERLMRMLNEVSRAGNVIVFIKNIHELINGTEGGEGMDVSGTLAEYLSSGRYLTFATTNRESYNKFIVQSQLGNLFGKVAVEEMDLNQTIQVLESKVGGIEYTQKVYFYYDAIEQCAKLAERYFHDQMLPESAINIMTEAASYVQANFGENHFVSGEEVARIVAEKTGIPVTALTASEADRLLHLEEEMHKRIVGQDEAVSMVANALRRARAEIRSTKRPIANFLFLGPTGVGKTELAKTIAEVYFGGEKEMIRIDMSEFQDKNAVYRLLGSPGQKGTGLLTEAVRQKPFSLVLLDEIEKADPDILNLFLQVFDDGRMTDSVGRIIDFTNTIIIATSNAGTAYVQDELRKGTAREVIKESLLHGLLKEYFRPEFLNRFDGIVMFKSMEKIDIKKVASILLERVKKDLEKKGIDFLYTDSALEYLSEVGFDNEFGARPMRRAIQERVENIVAELIVSGKVGRRDTIQLGERAGISVRARSK